jgi:hypothetical protein
MAVPGGINGRDFTMDGLNGNVGIGGIATPTEKLDVNGNLKFSGALMPNNLPGTTGDILTSSGAGIAPTWNSTTSLLSNEWHTTGNTGTTAGTNFLGTNDAKDLVFKTNSLENMRILNANGNVGIGTTTPNAKLQVEGTIQSGNVNATNGSVLLVDNYPNGHLSTMGTEYSSGGPVIGYGVYPSTTTIGAFLSSTPNPLPRSSVNLNKDISFFTGASQTSAINSPVVTSEVVRITNTGNVGIGTTAPTNKLEVVGNIKSEKAASGDFTGITLNSSTGGMPKISFHPSDNSERFNIKLTTSGTTTNDLLSFNSTTVNNALVVKGDGNIGVNETAPAYKLQVKGDIAATDGVYARSLYNVGTSTGTVYTDNIEPWTDNGVRIYDGNTLSHLHIEAVGPSFLQSYGTSGVGKNVLENTATSHLILQPNGSNVGVFNWNPTEKLDVSGNIKLSGALMPNNLPGTTGDILTSAGAGVAPTWNTKSALLGNEWHLTGNAGTTAGTNFLGTTDSRDLVFKTNSIENMRILNANGNVGIGTTAPSSYQHGGTNKVLEISNAGTALNDQSHIILSSGASTIANSSIGSISWALPNATASNKGVAAIGVHTGASSTAANPSSRIVFTTRDVTDTQWTLNRMVIAENGNVGIGTTLFANPAEKLTVENGNIQVGEIIGATGLGRKLFFSDAFNNSDAVYFQRENVGSNKSNLNLFIGDDYLRNDVMQTDKFNILGTNSTSTLLTIDSNTTNTGIGTSNPTEKLEVVGNVKFANALMPNNLPGTSGQVLVSSGAGTAPVWSSSSTQKFITTGSITGVYSIPLTEYTIRVFNSVSGIELPTAVGNQGKMFVILGSNGISSKTLTTLGGVVFDDVTNANITTINANQRYVLQSDGTDWLVIGR